MKKRIIPFVVFAFFACSLLAFADSTVGTSKHHGKFLEEVLQEIRESQGIGEDEKIDCSKVTDEQLEELGEAFMSVMHPDPEEHELMDRMMGGEGSPTLSSMHRMMGARYLGCYYRRMMPRMMGREMMPGMMGGMMSYPYPCKTWRGGRGMMGFGFGRHVMDFGYGSMFMGIIFLIIIGLVVYLVIQSVKLKRYDTSLRETPRDILKKRYARGEITKAEFEKIKKDLES